MAFQVTKTHHNGYRCCCAQEWEDDGEWFDSREEALAQVPSEMPDQGPDGGLKEVVVIDGSTGNEIASVSLSWTRGYGRGSGYDATRWFGWVDPGEGQPRISIDAFKGPGKTWAESVEIVKEKYRARKEREAQRKLEAAQKELAAYKK